MQTFSVAKETSKRGPYKIGRADPDQLGTGAIRLRQWRLYRDMTIAGLAEAADLSVGTITGIESGEVGWSYVTLHKLAKALKTSTGALLSINPLKEDEEFWSIWDRANGPQRQRITDHAIGVVGRKSR